jgi:transmembrane 9 superfamily protein 2/4
MRRSALVVALAAAAAPPLAAAFYLPGVAPSSYRPDDPVPLYVNSIRPIAAQDDAPLRAVVPYDYYHPDFQFCQPAGGPRPIGESLGSILFGDRIKTSPFELRMAANESCKHLCDVVYSPPSLRKLADKVELGYSLNWLVDGLPAGQEMEDVVSGARFYRPGFMLGSVDANGHHHLNNHYDIAVEYHHVSGGDAGAADLRRVVGVSVRPSSIDYRGKPDCHESVHATIDLDAADRAQTVSYTYSVYWVRSETAWATRWDKYLHVFDPNIHWFYLTNTAVILVILVATVSSVLLRTLRKDIARYNRLEDIGLDDFGVGPGTSMLGGDDDDGIQEDSGWKLVHGDVFRPPKHALLLSILVGNGAQLLVMTAITMLFALLGFLSPSNRGSLGSIMVISYTLLGFIGGTVSARVYKTWQGERVRANVALTPTIVPAIVLASVVFLNLFLWAKQSSGAVPFTTLLVLVAIWFLISVPLSFAGSWVGFRAAAPSFPTRTNQIPRQIPPSPPALRALPSMFVTGLLPFIAIFSELFFIMNSLWFRRIYYMFGFLFLCYGIMVMTAATATVLLTYFMLCAENYNWQWRSFLGAGMAGGYVFAYCVVNLVLKLSLGGFVGVVLYLGYSALISFLFFVVMGTIGYFSSWWFVRRIYASLKVD